MSNAAGSPSWNYAEVRTCLTSERLGSYFASCGDDLGRVFRLYEWNMQASASMLTLTSMVEVVVRNALDREMVSWATTKGHTSWFDAAPLDNQGRQDVQKARTRATRYGRRPEVHGRVVAELSLGFWRFLAESRYLTSLWIPAAHLAFASGSPPDLRQRREAVAGRLQQLSYVRNRAAHHEPIHRRDLLKDLDSAIELAGWVSPDAAGWIASTATVRQTVLARPPK